MGQSRIMRPNRGRSKSVSTVGRYWTLPLDELQNRTSPWGVEVILQTHSTQTLFGLISAAGTRSGCPVSHWLVTISMCHWINLPYWHLIQCSTR